MILAMNVNEKFFALRKGMLEFLVLQIIAAEKVYAADILKQLNATEFATQEGTLYPLLTRLKNADMLTYRWVESNSGPPRKYFSLTEKGLAFYRELETTWKELADAVDALANKTEKISDNP